MTDHPITPPQKLVEQWRIQAPDGRGSQIRDMWIATRAAQWGADQELEACREYVYERLKLTTIAHIAQDLRAARRPKPPSLKEQGFGALKLLKQRTTDPNIIEPLTRALEALP
jgi:hypothetical protein